MVYLDDVLIFSETLEEHISHVKQLLLCLQDYRLTSKLRKCEFHALSLSFLGFVISPEGVSMDLNHIIAINEWPTPTNIE